jgi:hypothetical protein
VRARKHRSAAAWLEAKAGSRVEDLADVLAHHYQEAHELAQASGDAELAGEVLPAARRMLELAGDRAVSLDQAEAEQAYRRALALYPAGDPERAPLLLKAGRLVLNVAQAQADAEEAVALYRSTGDELGEAEARLDVGRYMSYRGDDAAQLMEMDAARRLLERHPPGPVYALYLTRVAGNHMMAGRAAEGIVSADAALELAGRFGLNDRLAAVLQYRGVARTELGDLGGLDDLRESIELLKGAPALSGSIARINLADSTWIAVGAQAGLDIHLEAQAFAGPRGVLGSYWWSRAESDWMLYDLGRWDEVLALTDEIPEHLAQLGGLQVIELALPYRALVLARRGDLRAAASICDDLLPVARASDLQILGPTLAVAALTAPDDTDALGLVRELLDASRGASDRHRSLFVADLTRLCVAKGRLELARELTEGLLDIGRVGCARVHGAAVLAEADGKLVEAGPLFADAAARWEAFGGVPGRAAALLGRARCLGAPEPLAEARDLYASMGDEVGLAEAAELRS